MLNWTKKQIKFAHDLLKLEDQLANILSFFLGAILAFNGIPNITVQLILGFIATSCSLLGTNLINQFADVEIDRINKPHRPIPSGKISTRAVLILTTIVYFISLIAALLVSTQMFLLALAFMILGIAYSVNPIRLKEKIILSNITVAVGYNFINFLIGWVVFKSLESAPYSLLALLFFYDLIAINSKDYHDVEGDRRHEAKTLPIMLGIERSLRLDLVLQVGIQIIFTLFAIESIIPKYMLIISSFLLIATAIMFYDVEKSRNYMRFYYLSFGMHIVIRVLVLILFFSGKIQI